MKSRKMLIAIGLFAAFGVVACGAADTGETTSDEGELGETNQALPCEDCGGGGYEPPEPPPPPPSCGSCAACGLYAYHGCNYTQYACVTQPVNAGSCKTSLASRPNGCPADFPYKVCAWWGCWCTR